MSVPGRTAVIQHYYKMKPICSELGRGKEKMEVPLLWCPDLGSSVLFPGRLTLNQASHSGGGKKQCENQEEEVGLMEEGWTAHNGHKAYSIL